MDAGYRADEENAEAWSMNVRGLESSMSMIVRLDVPADHPQGLADMLGVFTTDEQTGERRCVGQAQAMDTDAGLLYFLSVYGEAVDAANEGALSFAWSSGLTGMQYPADELETFGSGALKGGLDEPVVLHFSKAELAPSVDMAGGLVAYPNPFKDELTIHWHGESAVKQLRIETAGGQLVELLDCDNLQSGPCRWVAGDLPAGVYFIHAVTERGNFSVRVVK
jgi:hypothetical protein